MQEENSEKVSYGRLVAFHGLLGLLIGYFILHPASMYIHSLFEPDEVGEMGPIRMAFSVSHIPMAIFFSAIGAAIGVVYGFFHARLAFYCSKVRELSITDPLTAVYNRRFLMDNLEEETRRKDGNLKKVSLMMIDVDQFKLFNDSFGHQKGDEVLAIIAHHLKSITRKTDYVARYGGEEFVIVLPETSKSDALKLAERLQSDIEKNSRLRFEQHPEGRITISIGLSELPSDAGDKVTLIRKADEALLKAKKDGRNRIRTTPVS